MRHLQAFCRVFGNVLLYFILPVFILEIFLAVPFTPDKEDLTSAIYPLLLDLLTITGVYLLFGFYAKKITDVVFKAKIEIKKVVQLIPISLLSRLPIFGVLIVLYLIFGDAVSDAVNDGVEFQWAIFDGSTLQSSLLGFVSFVILGPIHEELFFRGVIQRGLSRNYSPRTSIIYSALIFGLIHMHPGLIVSTFILGLFLGYIYYKWQNLWYSIILHTLMNLLPFVLQLAGSVRDQSL